eukprot:1503866-Alexandrium_andersonii.AAC.1
MLRDASGAPASPCCQLPSCAKLQNFWPRTLRSMLGSSGTCKTPVAFGKFGRLRRAVLVTALACRAVNTRSAHGLRPGRAVRLLRSRRPRGLVAPTAIA